jgi:carbonic anhydrase/acetyltransferase-like protein (isoleucine patch superfamily)
VKFNSKATRVATAFAAAGLLSAGVGIASSGAEPSFVDPTAKVAGATIGASVYVGPFARVLAANGKKKGAASVEVGDRSNVQDNVVVDGRTSPVALGAETILAHGAAVLGGSTIGKTGACPAGAAQCPSFVGFNAVVDGATIEKDAMVLHLARVASGVTIPSGRAVLPGKEVLSNAEVAAETVALTEANREFMQGVIKVNVEFAKGYTALAHESKNNVRGINLDPGETDFNPKRDLPRFAGRAAAVPGHRNRVIGDVRFADNLGRFTARSGRDVAVRADEGEPFTIGSIKTMGSRMTVHALEHTQVALGKNGSYGVHSVVHGGPADRNPTATGANFKLGSYGVFFRSAAGDDVTVGCRSLVQQANLPAGAVVPDKTIMIEATSYPVEWGTC